MTDFNQAIDKVNTLIDKLSVLTNNDINENEEAIVKNFTLLTDALTELTALTLPTDQASQNKMISTIARMNMMDTLLKNAKEKTRTEIMSVIKRLEANKSYQKQK